MARVLIAEDDAVVRETLRSALVDAGFEVVEAGDGEMTLRIVRSQPIDLVLCDVFMPGKDGLETIQVLRSEYPAVRIIAMSGGGSTGNVEMLPAARRLGAAEILHKPFKQAALMAAIQRVLAVP
jgi:CheY-like chemotaxis protein